MGRSLIRILSVFGIGVAGGIFGSQILWPLLAERPLFYQYRLEQAPTYVTERQEIVVQENTALGDALERVRKAVVGVRAVTGAGRVTMGSGLILTSDGFMVTLHELVPRGAAVSFFVDGEETPYEILKRDAERNLVLVKLQKSGLSSFGFASREEVKLGLRVFLAAVVVGEKGSGFRPLVLANEGVVRSIRDDALETTMVEESLVRGSPLFTIDGKVAGLNTVDKSGRVIAIPSTVIRQFTGF